MKSIVVYDSYTGNTKNIAKVIAKILECDVIHIENIKTYEIEKYDLIVLGTPVHAAMPSKKIKNFLKEKRIKKSYALFCTYGAYLIGKISTNNCFNYMKKRIDGKYVGKFKCPGFHHIFKTYKERPNKKDLKNAEKFAQLLKKNIK